MCGWSLQFCRLLLRGCAFCGVAQTFIYIILLFYSHCLYYGDVAWLHAAFVLPLFPWIPLCAHRLPPFMRWRGVSPFPTLRLPDLPWSPLRMRADARARRFAACVCCGDAHATHLSRGFPHRYSPRFTRRGVAYTATHRLPRASPSGLPPSRTLRGAVTILLPPHCVSLIIPC